jgi:Cu/Ag efflux protein CusF
MYAIHDDNAIDGGRLSPPTFIGTLLLTLAAIWGGAANAFGCDGCSILNRSGWSVQRVQAQEATPGGTFRGVGVVSAVDSGAGALTVDHEEIKGLMPAMIMMYRVRPPSLIGDLRLGDKIEFIIDAKTYTIHDVRLIEHAK